MIENYALLILTPMLEENQVLTELVADIGYSEKDLKELSDSKKLCIHETGMGGLNIMNFIFNSVDFFANNNVDVVLCGFAGSLKEDLNVGKSYQVVNVTDFNFIDFQGAGDFEIIQTPSDFFNKNLNNSESSSLKIPHFKLNTSNIGEAKQHNLISVPALLQGQKTKQYLASQGVEIVDMEGFALACALSNIKNTASTDIIKVITDSPTEKFEFSRLVEYKNYLRKCELIKKLLKTKFKNF